VSSGTLNLAQSNAQSKPKVRFMSQLSIASAMTVLTEGNVKAKANSISINYRVSKSECENSLKKI